uniref:Hydroxyproline-rich glycoprotein family protein n=1 Tax=Glycine max TaxID=3847 RepID=A0A0R0FWY3_SOYBN
MANVRLCGLKPLLFGRKSCVSESMKSSTTPKKSSMAQNEGKGGSIEWSFVGADQLISMMKVHKKIFVFRDIMDLAPLNSSASLHEALKSLGQSWMMNNDCMEKNNYELPSCKDNTNIWQLGETMSGTLDCLINFASEKFDIMEEDPKKEFSPPSSSFGKVMSNSNSFSESSYSPTTPLWSLRIQGVAKQNPIDLKRLSYHMSPPHTEIHKIEKKPTINMEIIDHKAENHGKSISQEIVLHSDTTSDHGKTYDKPQAKEDVENLSVSPKPLETPTLQQKAPGSISSSPPLTPTPPAPLLPTTYTVPLPQVLQPNMALPPPPLPPVPFKTGLAPAPPPLFPRGNGAAAPPPPPPGTGRSLRPKATTKLKRLTQLGNLYRTLKGKVEGSSLKGKSSGGRTSAIGAGSTGGKQGMADALAEMAKRSSYFQQIEDVQRYTKQIIELRSAITNFRTNDMTELIKFHKDVESVLSRFEGFPSKKLEATRMAATLYLRLDSILTELQNWNIVPPMGQFLDKTNIRIKTELDGLERNKDEESMKFKGHNIEFDFHILIKIKEAMVDVSSNCMEDSGSNISDGKRKEDAKLLWRDFQFAFRVYTLAGGHDDRADKLTRELAKEIESDPNQP